jgi:hypothetical protein
MLPGTLQLIQQDSCNLLRSSLRIDCFAKTERCSRICQPDKDIFVRCQDSSCRVGNQFAS